MGQQFETQALIFAIILVVYILTAHTIDIKKIKFLHESAVSIVLGILSALVFKYAFDMEIEFNNDIFFTIILPSIIFSAGYSLRKSLFFQNLAIISFLGIFGTIIGFIGLATIIGLFNQYVFKVLTFSQVLLLSSVLCATDTIAAMALIKPEKYPTLNAVLFGQGIINDAVSIILFRTVFDMKIGTQNSFNLQTVMIMVFKFAYLLIFSLLLGLVSGFGLSYLFKKNISFTKSPIKQTALILLNGYITYLIGEQLQLSGIISLFTCAVVMGHYCFMNISQQARRGTGLAFQTVSYIAQAFVFAYLGASLIAITGQWMAVMFALCILLLFPFVRAAMVYILPLIYYIRRKKFPLSPQQTKIVWYNGIVRGVIAFALCLQIQSQDPYRQQFIRMVTIVIVMFTTIFGATMLKSFAKLIGLPGSDDSQDQQQPEAFYNRMGDNQQNGANSEMVPSNYNHINFQSSKNQNSNHYKNFEMEQSNNKNKLKNLQNQYINPIFGKQSINYELDEHSNKPQKIENQDL